MSYTLQLCVFSPPCGVSVDQGEVRVTSAPDLMLLIALTAGQKRNSKAFFLVDDLVPFKIGHPRIGRQPVETLLKSTLI